MAHTAITRNVRWWLLATTVATALVLVGLSCSKRRTTSDPNDVLSDTVTQAIQGNLSKLSCVNLAWRSESKGFGIFSDQPQTSGIHQLWWNKNRTAILCKTNSVASDPNGQIASSVEQRFMTYDGRTFRIAEMSPPNSIGNMEVGIFKRPTSAWYGSNYLQHVGWEGTGGLNDVSKPTEEGVELWSSEIGHDSSQIIKREFRNKMDQVGIRFYDVSKGCMLVSRRQYYKNQLNLQVDVSYKRVSGGAWFPVRVMTQIFNINTGEIIRQSNVNVDITNKGGETQK